MRYCIQVLLTSSAVVAAGCSGPTDGGDPAPNPTPTSTSIPATKPPSADPKVTLERPADGAKIKLGDPILCVGRVEFPAGMSVGYNVVLIENGILLRGKLALMYSTSVPLERTGDGYIFKATLDSGKLPQQPGKYAMRAMLVEMEPAEGGGDAGRSRNLASKIIHYEVGP